MAPVAVRETFSDPPDLRHFALGRSLLVIQGARTASAFGHLGLGSHLSARPSPGNTRRTREGQKTLPYDYVAVVLWLLVNHG